MASASELAVEVRDLTNEQYQADRTAVSKTSLWTFAKRRRLYEAQYVLGIAPEREATTAMEIGTLVDCALLEPEKFDDLVAVMPKELLSADGGIRSNAAKAHRDALEAAGKIVVKQDQYDTVMAAVDAFRKRFGKWLDAPAATQESIFWTDPETGLRCRCRLDWRPLKANVVFDLKTTQDASPRAFARRCEELGYFLQDAHYSAGVEALTGEEPEFYFVVQEVGHPFGNNIQRFTEDDRQRAKEFRRQLMIELAECLERNDFAEPWEAECIDINIRPYCFER